MPNEVTKLVNNAPRLTFFSFVSNSFFSFSSGDADNFLFIRADYKLVKIPLADILYIEGLGDYLKVYYGAEKLVVARMTMKNILAKLSPNEFLRVHRSFIVPFSKIENVRNKTIHIKEHEIPIGSSYENEFFEKFKS